MAFDWKKIVSAVAPTLGTALGGPLGGLALSTLSNALLGKPDGSASEIEAAMAAAGPDALLKVREADNAFATRMRELDIDLEKVHQADRADARGREAKTGDRLTPRLLASVIVGGFLAMVWYVLSGQVQALKDPVAAGLIGTLIGYVSAKADQVVSYYFGSSAGSQRKDELLQRSKPAS